MTDEYRTTKCCLVCAGLNKQLSVKALVAAKQATSPGIEEEELDHEADDEDEWECQHGVAVLDMDTGIPVHRLAYINLLDGRRSQLLVPDAGAAPGKYR